MPEIDYLVESKPIDGQKLHLISFLTPEGVKNCNIRAYKVYASCDTEEEFTRLVEQYKSEDPNFPIFRGETGKWCQFGPDPNSVKDQHHTNKELNELMKAKLENEKKADEMEKQRQHEMLMDNIKTDAKPVRNKTHARMQNTVEERRRKELDKSLANPQTERSVIDKNRELNEKTKVLDEAQDSIKSIDDKINRLKNLVSKKK